MSVCILQVLIKLYHSLNLVIILLKIMIDTFIDHDSCTLISVVRHYDITYIKFLMICVYFPNMKQ